ncbi:MAG TPA: tetratricopeptide repeat protein [Anaerolineae bacterium]|nr:tetratricopeptide repeat protein [Anaerolineae bacterium]
MNREALSLLRGIWKRCSDLLEQAGPLAETELKVLEGEVLTYLGEEENLERAGELLEKSIEEASDLHPEDEFERWRRQVLLAEVYNVLGYYYRNLGQFRKAVEAYRRAVAQWRLLEEGEKDRLRRMALRAQHANTLNNLSWALAEQGHLAEAAHFCEDALEMRVALGPAAPVALSLNTYGLILVRDDKPHRAQVLTGRALGIFRGLDYPRGIGLSSIALAEALRRMSAVEYLYAPEEKADLLRRAEQHASDAVEIFSGPQMRERSRLVEALIERGCVYRQWAWLWPQYESSEDPDQDELARRAEADLKRAMEEAGEGMAYRRLDAHVDLAWLYYYMRQYKQAEKEARAAIASVPEEYRFGKGRSDAQQLPHSFYWLLLGKTYLLLGETAMRQFEYEGRKEEKYLRRGGLYYTLGLAYDEFYAPDFRDLRRAIYRIYIRIRRLNEGEFASLHKGIREAVEVCGKSPTRMDRLLAERNLPVRAEVEWML